MKIWKKANVHAPDTAEISGHKINYYANKINQKYGCAFIIHLFITKTVNVVNRKVYTYQIRMKRLKKL